MIIASLYEKKKIVTDSPPRGWDEPGEGIALIIFFEDFDKYFLSSHLQPRFLGHKCD